MHISNYIYLPIVCGVWKNSKKVASTCFKTDLAHVNNGNLIFTTYGLFQEVVKANSGTTSIQNGEFSLMINDSREVMINHK